MYEFFLIWIGKYAQVDYLMTLRKENLMRKIYCDSCGEEMSECEIPDHPSHLRKVEDKRIQIKRLNMLGLDFQGLMTIEIRWIEGQPDICDTCICRSAALRLEGYLPKES